MGFKSIARAEAIELFGAQRVHDAEVYALSREPERSTSVSYQARQRDPLDATRWLTWFFRATPEMIDQANRIDTQN
jgi:hypothetical protein